jgi:ketosteroid isomerase-like protein
VGLASNKELVLSFLRTSAGGAEGVARAALSLAPSARWHNPASIPTGGTYEGRDAIVAMLGSDEVSGLYQAGSVEVTSEHVLAEADLVLVVFAVHAVTRRGDPYENRYVFLYRVEDGLIHEVWESFDTLTFHRAVFGDV